MSGIPGVRVLLIGAGSPSAAPFIKALEGQDISIWVAASDPYAAGLYLVPEDRRLIVPEGAIPRQIRTLIGICSEFDINIMVPFNEDLMIPIARAKEDFRSIGTQLLLAPLSGLKTCLDSWNLAQLRSDTIPLPQTAPFLQNELPEGWEFPVVLKSRFLDSGSGVHLISTQAVLNRILPDPNLVLQEYLPGKTYSVEVFANAQGEIKAAVPLQHHANRAGVVEVSRIVRDQKLESLGHTVAHLLGIRFAASVSFKQNRTGEPVLVSVRPNYFAHASLTAAGGVNMPLLCLNAVQGASIEDAACQYQEVAFARYQEIKVLSLPSLQNMERIQSEIHEPQEMAHAA